MVYKENMYKVVFIPKKSGGVRKLSIPNDKLKAIQRDILKKIYDKIKGNNKFRFCYGFMPNKNIYDNAAIHCKNKFVLNIDIEDFFDSCRPINIQNFFYNLHLDEDIASEIEHYTDIPTNLQDLLYYESCLPQGAPTSPIIANMSLIEADLLIFYMLRTYISTDIKYTRYADDITISSNSRAIFSKSCLNIVSSTLKKYGFSINHNKTRRLTPSQRLEITGLCINSKTPTVSRKIRRKIKAMIHNAYCAGSITRQQYNKINGYLSFVAIVPKHREFVKQQREKLNKINIIES